MAEGRADSVNGELKGGRPAEAGDKPGLGRKIAAAVLLVVAVLLSAVAGLLTPHENRAEWTGAILGSALFPVLFCLLCIGFFSLFKRFRNAGSQVNIVLWVGIISIFTRCTEIARKAEAAKENTPKPVPAAPLPEPLTSEDLDEIGDVCAALEKSLRNGDISGFKSRFDNDALLDRVLQGFVLAPSSVRKLKESFLEKDLATHLVEQLARAASEGEGELTFLRVREVDGEARALFRIYFMGGLTYHEWVFQKRADETSGDKSSADNPSADKTSTDTPSAGNAPRIVDVYQFDMGALFSESLRDLVISPIVNEADPEKREETQAFHKTMQAMAATQETAPEETKRIFDSLSKTDQNRKLAVRAYLNAAARISTEEHTAALSRFIELFPDDPALLKLSLDYYTLKEEFPAALAQVNRLDAVVRDPALDTLRSTLFFQMNDFEAAETTARRALERGDTREETYTALLDSLVYRRKFDEAVEIAKKLDADFEVEVDLNTEDPAYLAFIASKPYRKWRRTVESLSK